MKTIHIEIPREPFGIGGTVPVMVDWFPRLTDDQITANVVARIDGKPEPFPDPNLIRIEFRYSSEPQYIPCSADHNGADD